MSGLRGFNNVLKVIISVFILPSFLNFRSDDFRVQSGYEKLNLTDTSMVIENSISFYTSSLTYHRIEAVPGEKFNIKAEDLVINGDSVVSEGISTRGQSTLNFKRKSYAFRLRSAAVIRYRGKTESFKKFYILSLSMDKYYSHNRLAFEMMKAAGLFDLFYSFCELSINDQSQGVCMVMERPEDWAFKHRKAPLLIRRGYDHTIDNIITDKNADREDIRKYSDNFKQLYRDLNKYEGEELYNKLSVFLDLELYMKWMAFNFLVRNGDYTDEVFFYIDPSIGKFRIIPWDYDDVFALKPHEGNLNDQKISAGRLVFSTEDLLDKKIAYDPYLYKLYLIQFREVLGNLSASVLKNTFENTYSELYPYYAKNDIIGNSKFDYYKDASLINLKNDLEILYRRLLMTRDQCLIYLDNLPR